MPTGVWSSERLFPDLLWCDFVPVFFSRPHSPSLCPSLSCALCSLFCSLPALTQAFSIEQKAVIFIHLQGPWIGLDAWTVRARSMLGVSDVGGGEVVGRKPPQGYWSLSWWRNKSNYCGFLIYAVTQAQKRLYAASQSDSVHRYPQPESAGVSLSMKKSFASCCWKGEAGEAAAL